MNSKPYLSANQKKEVVTKFMCPCGGCDDELDACTCTMKNGAEDVMKFINNKFVEGHHSDHVILLVQQRYGGIKPEYRNLIK